MRTPLLFGFFQSEEVAEGAAGWPPVLLMFFGDGQGAAFTPPTYPTPAKRTLDIRLEDRVLRIDADDRVLAIGSC